MRYKKFLDGLFAKLGYFPLAPLPPMRIPIEYKTLPFITISNCIGEKVIREAVLKKGAQYGREAISSVMRERVLAEAAKYIEITECENPIEIRATLRVVPPIANDK